jgi:hypothetical protein
MKIVINAPSHPANGYEIIVEEKHLINPNSWMRPREWDESEISDLLTERQYQLFEDGKYEFDVPTWKIRLIQNEMAPKTREHLLFISQFIH